MTLSAGRPSPCDWGLEWETDIQPCCSSVTPGVDPTASQQEILDAAVSAIWGATGERYGVCPVTFRPAIRCGCPRRRACCGCRRYDKVDLTNGGPRPVAAVAEVRVDGVALTAGTDYVVTGRRWLLRLGGNRWPACQDEAATPAPLEVDITVGTYPPDDLVRNGVAPLACELLKACTPGCSDCQLDMSTIVNIQREGVTMAVMQNADAWRTGGFGIRRVDAAVARNWPAGPGVKTQAGGVFDPARRDTSGVTPAW